MAWLDAAKGAAIVLVVFGHCWRGLHSAELIASESLFATIDQLIYAFHMPVFFFLAGWTFPPSLARRGPSEFIWGRVRRLLYPLALWTYIFGAFKLFGGEALNEPENWRTVFQPPLPPKWHFWFLWALFLIQIAGWMIWLIRPGRDRAGGWTPWLAAGLLSAGLFLWTFGEVGVWIWGALWGAPFFFLGAAFGRLSWPAFSLSAGVAAGVTFLLFDLASLSLHSGPGKLVVGLGATLGFCAVFKSLGDLRPGLAARIAPLGEAAMAIFLAHTIFSAGLRVVLLRIGVEDLVLHLFLGTVVGVLGPWYLYLRTRGRVWGKVLGF